MKRDCTFCGIIAGEQHGAFVYEDERVVGFLDINQSAAGHTLVVPRAHVPYWWDLSDKDASAIAIAVKPIMNALREVFEPTGMLVEQRNGGAAGQEIFHMHLHLIPAGVSRGSYVADRASLNQRAAEIRAALVRVRGSDGC